jgi:hypothetical protein
VAGDPDPRFVPGITGTWTTVAYNPANNTTELTVAGNPFAAGALNGLIVNADVSQTRQALILSNATNAIVIAGNATTASGPMGYVEAGDTFRIIYYELRSDSPCINVGDNNVPTLPATDIAGSARVALGIVDLGAYESPVAASATVLAITHTGSPVSNQSVVCFDVIFSRAVNDLTASDFVVDGLDGQATATIESVTGHDYRWQVCVNSAPGNGALTVDLVDGDHSITDILGYTLAAGYNSDPLSQAAYYIDHLAITMQPAGANKVTGESHEFRLQAQGGTGTLHYLWKRNGLPVPEALDSPVFTIEPIELSNSGTYTCEVSDDYTALTSNPAVLTVTQPLPLAGLTALAILAAAIAASALSKMRKRK